MTVVDISTITEQEFQRLNEAYKRIAGKVEGERDVTIDDLELHKPKLENEFLYVALSENNPAGCLSGIVYNTFEQLKKDLPSLSAVDHKEYPTLKSGISGRIGIPTKGVEQWVYIKYAEILAAGCEKDLIEHLRKVYPSAGIFFEPISKTKEQAFKSLGFKDSGLSVFSGQHQESEGIIWSERTTTPLLYLPPH